MALTSGIFELVAVTAGSARADDVLVMVDVHDPTQAAQGSTKKFLLSELYRTETTAVTVSTPLPDIRQTWNAGGVTFTAVKLNVTDTASAAGSMLLQLQIGGTNKFVVDKSGNMTVAGTFIAQGATAQVSALTATTITATGNASIGTNGTLTTSAGYLIILPGGAAPLYLRSGAAGQAINLGDNTGAATPVNIAGGLTIATVGITVSAGGVTVTGNSTITGTLGVTSATNAGLITIDTTTGATSDTTKLVLKRGGTTKWTLGNNADGGTSDVIALVDNGSVVRLTMDATNTLTYTGHSTSGRFIIASTTGGASDKNSLLLGVSQAWEFGTNIDAGSSGDLILNRGATQLARFAVASGGVNEITFSKAITSVRNIALGSGSTLSLITSGGAAIAGQLTLVTGTKTVNTTAATSTCNIFFQRITAGGTIGFATTYTKVAGTSFTVSSDSALDTSVYAWWIVETY